MSIVRLDKRTRFTVVNNVPINDARLSLEEIGLLTYLYSKPDDWVVRPSEIAGAHTNGIAAVRTILTGLAQKGYIVKMGMTHKGDGTFAGHDYAVYEEPQGVCISPYAVKPHTVEPHAVKCTLPNTHLTKTLTRSKELVSDMPAQQTFSLKDVTEELDRTEAIARTRMGAYSVLFEAFWEAYGRKGNKYAAHKRWKEAKCEVLAGEVMRGLARYLASGRTTNGYKQDAERWLKEHGWESEWTPETTPSRNGYVTQADHNQFRHNADGSIRMVR